MVHEVDYAYERPGRQIRQNKNSRQLINAAIRGELVAGNEALDALTVADSLILRLRDGRAPPIVMDLAGQTLDAVQAIAAAMRAEIRQRYGMPPEGQEELPDLADSHNHYAPHKFAPHPLNSDQCVCGRQPKHTLHGGNEGDEIPPWSRSQQ
jgi:hypothetical protein